MPRFDAIFWISALITANLLTAGFVLAFVAKNSYVLEFPPEGRWLALVVYGLVSVLSYIHWGRKDKARKVLKTFEFETASERKARTIVMYCYVIATTAAFPAMGLLAQTING
jgi:hypothetical protein